MLARAPAHLLIVGGGYIGLELGSVWRRLGSRVTVVESQERILPAMDEGLAKEAQRLFARQGMVFMCGQKVLSAQTHASGCMLAMDDGSQLEGTHILTAVGRMPRSGGGGSQTAWNSTGRTWIHPNQRAV